MDEEAVFEYLDNLRDNGDTNMFGSPAYIQKEFSVSKREALEIEIVIEWMDTFSERHPVEV